MKYQRDRAWIEISLDAIEENYRRIRHDIGDSGIIAVLKANAYGLGAVKLGRFLNTLGCRFFAVACIEEAVELREGGVEGDIMTLGPVLPEHVAVAVEHDIITNLISVSHAEALSREAQRLGVTLRGHLKADSGMARFGIVLEGRMDEAVEDALHVFSLPNLSIEGVFTHYTSADFPVADQFNLHEIGLYDEFCARLREKGLSFIRHSAASFYAAVYPETHNDYVRLASLLLGIEGPDPRGTVCEMAVELKSRIYQIKDVPMGRPVSYGPISFTLRDSRIAVVPIGYADGLRRTIQTKASLLVNGQYAPIIGKICMDYLMLDVTDVDCKEGDEVVVFGRSGDKEQSIVDMARLYGATVGEVPTVLNPRLPRFYLKNGEIVGRMDD